MILITGATGSTGSEIIEQLRQSQHQLRCMTSRPDAARELEGRGFQTVVADFDRPETLPQALQGIRKAYLVCPPDERLETREKAFIDAARGTDIHIVKLSAFWSAPDSPSPNLQAHARVEQHLRSSGLPFTILRPHGFYQTFLWMNLPMIQGQGILPVPGGTGKAPLLDIRDVASAAVKSLTEPGHENQAYDLTGPEAVTMETIAQALSQGLGKPVQYMDMPEQQLIGAMKGMGVADSSIAHVATIFRWIREGKVDFTTSVLKETFHIEPKSWSDFATDLAAGKTGAATSFKPPGPPG